MSRQFFRTIVSSGFVSATVVSNQSTADLEFLTSRFSEQMSFTLPSPIGPPKPPCERILSLLAVAKEVSRHIPRAVTDIMLRPLGPLEAVEVEPRRRAHSEHAERPEPDVVLGLGHCATAP